jgi:hypothetical protein
MQKTGVANADSVDLASPSEFERMQQRVTPMKAKAPGEDLSLGRVLGIAHARRSHAQVFRS